MITLREVCALPFWFAAFFFGWISEFFMFFAKEISGKETP